MVEPCYDQKIVEAAEQFVAPQHEQLLEIRYQRLADAIQAKQGAQRPTCNIMLIKCEKPAVQELTSHDGQKLFRCQDHRIEVRGL